MLLADLAARSACAAVPVWQPDRRAYGWGRTTASTRWRQGKFRIEEPDPVVLVPPEFLRVLVLPGVAFDFTGGRLGRGGGFFDRLIVQSPAFMIGLCTERCLVESLPMEPHDVRMDAVMTEKRIRFTPGAAVKLEQMINGRYVC
jgi:5-formyltetrahydrofolate cyclo-ligase